MGDVRLAGTLRKSAILAYRQGPRALVFVGSELAQNGWRHKGKARAKTCRASDRSTRDFIARHRCIARLHDFPYWSSFVQCRRFGKAGRQAPWKPRQARSSPHAASGLAPGGRSTNCTPCSSDRSTRAASGRAKDWPRSASSRFSSAPRAASCARRSPSFTGSARSSARSAMAPWSRAASEASRGSISLPLLDTSPAELLEFRIAFEPGLAEAMTLNGSERDLRAIMECVDKGDEANGHGGMGALGSQLPQAARRRDA